MVSLGAYRHSRRLRRRMTREEFAAFLLRHMTAPERLLFSALSNGKCGGFTFEPQKPLWCWIVDFLCPEAKLVVEVDGPDHTSGRRARQDKLRDTIMAHNGYSILRVTNQEVLEELPAVVEMIERIAKQCLYRKQEKPNGQVQMRTEDSQPQASLQAAE
jgi:very-short-patch-repair endonuclease